MDGQGVLALDLVVATSIAELVDPLVLWLRGALAVATQHHEH
jgi:hypothetical protein